jgi:hypothetical protein
MTREYTIKLLNMMDQGLISAKDVAEMALGYLSEDDVHDMMLANDILDEDEDEDEDEPDCDDSDDGYALASAGHGTDEDYGSAEDTL